MSEAVYCPKCDGTEHKKRAGQIGGQHGKAVSLTRGLARSSFGLIGYTLLYQSREEEEAEYVPITYCCQSCGHEFLSQDTYEEELNRAHQNKRSWIILSILSFIPTAFFILLLIACLHPPISSFFLPLLLSIVFIVLFVACINNIICSGKATNELAAEYEDFLECQKKHIAPPSVATGERIPAWKRVQQEQLPNN